MMFAEVHSSEWAVPIGTAAAAFVAQFIFQVMTWFQQRKAAREAKEAAEQRLEAEAKAERDRAEIKRKLEEKTKEDLKHNAEVKETLAQSNLQMHSESAIIHGLVNGSMTAQKKTLALVARQLADSTGKPEHIKFAEDCEAIVKELDQQVADVSKHDPVALANAKFPEPPEKDKPPVMGAAPIGPDSMPAQPQKAAPKP